MNKISSKIVTIVNSIGQTSMPLNEFVLYRNKVTDFKAKQLVLSFDGEDQVINNNVEIYSGKGNLLNFIKKFDLINSQDIIHIHNSHVGILFFLFNLFNKKKRTIFTVHSMYERYSLKVKILTLGCILFSNYTTFVSESAYASFPRVFRKFFSYKLKVIVNGVNCEFIDDFIGRQNDISKYDNPTIINVGRLVKEKNQFFLLDIISKIEGVNLLILGEGRLKEDLVAYATRLNIIDRVFFVGEVEREKVYKEILKSHLYISTSRYEGMPIAVLEAIYLEIPIILSDINSHLEIKQKINNIDLAPFDDIDRWVELINKSLSSNNTITTKENKILAMNEFGLYSMHLKYNDLYFCN